ncbi:MAG: pyruvate kinase [Pyrinomonadaceae bacterium]|nr:pyruvate kinase [Blastocatellia bacterium]MCW5955761.1 pyruvate kinase [Pyrinomonadaceae bacterium]
MRKAKILATLGPASSSQSTIEAMLTAGVNAVRINMSHGSHEEHTTAINTARSAAHKLGLPLAILVDLSGPKIRTRTLKDGAPVELIPGNSIVITTREVEGTAELVSTNFAELPEAVKPDTTILLDDGALELRVEDVNGTDVLCRVIVGGLLKERKGINLPNTPLPIPSMTEKDHADLKWAMEQNVDFIALSFVRTAQDCREVKNEIKRLNRRKMGRALLVAKIEKAEAIENLDEIIAETDGVMVARGDLGVETSVELVPVYQKRIIGKAIANDRFVITATQMLQSMIDSPHPTRAEASDVANAVWDGTDAVMLSAETASGSYPIETVQTMARIIDSAETVRPSELRKPVKLTEAPTGRTSQALCKAAAYAAREMMTDKVAVFTESGLMALRLSSVRSGLQTFALTTSNDVQHQLSLIWGVTPFFHQDLEIGSEEPHIGEGTMLDLLNTQEDKTGDLLKVGEKTLLNANVVTPGETIIMMAGRLSGHGLSSSVIVWTIGEEMPRR